MGSLKSPCGTTYRSSIETIGLNFLLLRKSRFWRQTNSETDGQDECVKALSLSRAAPS